MRRGIEAKAYVLRNVGDLNRDHLESGEGGNGLDIPQVLRLTGAKSVVGRVPSSAVNLAVGVATVSSAHAMVDLTPDGKVMVTDLTSTNGTYIDGEELLPGNPQELTEGGEVIFGDEHCVALLQGLLRRERAERWGLASQYRMQSHLTRAC